MFKGGIDDEQSVFLCTKKIKIFLIPATTEI